MRTLRPRPATPRAISGLSRYPTPLDMLLAQRTGRRFPRRYSLPGRIFTAAMAEMTPGEVSDLSRWIIPSAPWWGKTVRRGTSTKPRLKASATRSGSASSSTVVRMPCGILTAPARWTATSHAVSATPHRILLLPAPQPIKCSSG